MPNSRSLSRLGGRPIAVVVIVALVGCSGGGGAADSPSGSVPIVTPSSAYGPFPYANAVQKSTFAAYLQCAEDLGVDYEGPFQDSTGHGIFFKLAEGEQASHANQERVGADCPQGTVGLFGTPVGHVRIASFARAAMTFARCVRAHGVPDYPSPAFDAGDPVDAFWRLPFPWSSEAFADAAKACADPLQGYLFSS
jgi:hypothetical protein